MSTIKFYPPNSISNITIWDKVVTEEDLLYMDEHPEWISLTLDSSALSLLPPFNSYLAPEYCLAWYPMCEHSGSTIYNHVPGAGNDIVLNNYTEIRRTLEANNSYGLQTLAYTRDTLGKITGYASDYSIDIDDDRDIVDSTYELQSNKDWMLEESMDLDHYIYIYSKDSKTIKIYKNGLYTEETNFNIATNIINTVDTFGNTIVDSFGNIVTDVVYGENDTYKLDHNNLDFSITNASSRQFFRLYTPIPDNIDKKIEDMYNLFSSIYLDILDVPSLWSMDTFVVLTDSYGNFLEYNITPETLVLNTITPDSDYVTQV